MNQESQLHPKHNEHSNRSGQPQQSEQPDNFHSRPNKQNQSHSYNQQYPRINGSPLKQSLIDNLPIHITELVKQNKYLQKQNAFLNQQLQQKQAQIQTLKNQIYQSILDQTQSKIHCLQIIEEEATIKAKKMTEERMEQFYQNDDLLEQMKEKITFLQLTLQKEKKANEILATNVVELKDFIIDAMEQKDLIIRQLKYMILNAENDPIPHMNQLSKCNYQLNQSNLENNKKRTKSRDRYLNENPTKNQAQTFIATKNYHKAQPNQSSNTTKAKIVKNI